MHYTFLVVEYFFEMCIIIIYFHYVEPIYIIISRLRLGGLLQVLCYWCWICGLLWVAGGGGSGGECGRVVGLVVAAACRGKGREGEKERERVNRNAICFCWVFMVVVLWVAGGGCGL